MLEILFFVFICFLVFVAVFIIGGVLTNRASAADGIVHHRTNKDFDPDEGGNVSVNLPPSIQRCMTDIQCERAADKLCNKGLVEWCDKDDNVQPGVIVPEEVQK
jgi:hypothetical protein